MYLPRLYNPYPFIYQTLHFLGFRVKKIDEEWIIIKPQWWITNSKLYDEQIGKSKYLNSRDYNAEHGTIPSIGSGTV